MSAGFGVSVGLGVSAGFVVAVGGVVGAVVLVGLVVAVACVVAVGGEVAVAADVAVASGVDVAGGVGVVAGVGVPVGTAVLVASAVGVTVVVGVGVRVGTPTATVTSEQSLAVLPIASVPSAHELLVNRPGSVIVPTKLTVVDAPAGNATDHWTSVDELRVPPLAAPEKVMPAGTSASMATSTRSFVPVLDTVVVKVT